MKKFVPFLLLLALIVYPVNANAGLSEGCFPAVECNGTDNYYNGSCKPKVDTIAADCPAPGVGKIAAFSCSNGCFERTKPAPNPCPGGVIISGTCYTLLDVVDDQTHPTNKAYKVWDGTDLTEVPLVDTSGCADDEVVVSDSTSSTGWKCSTQGGGLWTQNGNDISYDTGNVGIGDSTPSYKLDVNGVGRFTGDVIIEGDTDNDGVNASLQINFGAGTMLLDGNEIDVNSEILNLNGNSATDVLIANGGGDVGIGTSNLESSYAVTIRESAASGLYTYGNIYGVWSGGDIAGGYFEDNTEGSKAYAGYGPYGLWAVGATYGLYANGPSYGVSGVSTGGTGVNGTGTVAGGWFKDTDSGGYAYVGYGNTGIEARGSYQGGYFVNDNTGAYARAGFSGYGVYAAGDTAGGRFIDKNNTSTYAYVGYGNYSFYGSADGYFGGDVIIAGDTESDGSSGSLRINYGSGDMFIDGNEIDSTNSGGLYLNYNSNYPVKLKNSVLVTSDRRLKKNITTLNYGLAEVSQMRPVSFVWKDDDSGKERLGFIAQEMATVISEVTDYDNSSDESIMSLSYTELIPVLVNAIQELKNEKDELQAVVCELKPDAEICN